MSPQPRDKSNKVTLLKKFLLSLPYFSGIVDMIFRFFPALTFVFRRNSLIKVINLKAFAVYTHLQYVPLLLFTFLYVRIIRAEKGKVSYFTKYHVMHYLILFTAEQLLSDIFIRVSIVAKDSFFTLGTGILFLWLVTLMALDCIRNIYQGTYTNIPLITDAVIVHIGRRREKGS